MNEGMSLNVSGRVWAVEMAWLGAVYLSVYNGMLAKENDLSR